VTFKELAQELCRREGKNVGVNIAQVSELLDCLIDIIMDRPTETMKLLADSADLYPDIQLSFKPYMYVPGPKFPKAKKRKAKR
jgi:hypothetical protein